jgi:LacI family transcriptional regulator
MAVDDKTTRTGIHRVAKLAGVSIGTVDRAMHGRAGISAATRDKVLNIARKLNYRPNPAARILSVGRPHFRIGVCIPQEIHFFYDQMRAGIFDETRRSHGLGVEIVYRPVKNLGEHEDREVAALVHEGVNGIIVTPGDPKAITGAINRAEKSGVRVICVTTDAPRSRRSSVVCVDPELNGRLAAELMSKFVDPGSAVAMLTGMLTAEEHRLKAKGFRDGFAHDCPGGSAVAVLEAHESAAESDRKTRQLLAAHPELAGIYVSTVNSLPVCRALHEAGRGDIKLITTDVFPEMLPYFHRGTIRASIYQDPYLQGQTAVRLLVDHWLHNVAVPPTHYLNPAVVLRTNLHLFREAQTGAPKRKKAAGEKS